MLGKMRKIIKSQEGFTLIELITVLVILAIIMGIGIPMYMKMQMQSEWDSDKATITSFSKAAELYSAQKGHITSVKISDLVTAGMIDGNTVLNRTSTGGANTAKATVLASYADQTFTISATTGYCTDLNTASTGVIAKMIGARP